MAYLANNEQVKITVGGQEVRGLKSLPDFGGGSIESVEVTTLAETKKRYIAGLEDSVSELAYTFNYDPFEAKKLAGEDGKGKRGVAIEVTLADGTTISYTGAISLTINAASSGAAMEMTANTTVDGEVTIGFPKSAVSTEPQRPTTQQN